MAAIGQCCRRVLNEGIHLLRLRGAVVGLLLVFRNWEGEEDKNRCDQPGSWAGMEFDFAARARMDTQQKDKINGTKDHLSGKCKQAGTAKLLLEGTSKPVARNHKTANACSTKRIYCGKNKGRDPESEEVKIRY